MKFFSAFVFVLLLTVDLFAVDRWGAFSDPFPIRDAVPFGENGVLLATEGGIRFRMPDSSFIYHSEHGLETSSFYALVSSSQGIVAVSEFGLIALYKPETDSWSVLNRSYVKNNVRVIPGTVKISGDILIIPFEDRLAFYDVAGGISVLTINRIGSFELASTPVRRLAVRGDSLYVKTTSASFARQMPWGNLSSDVRLSDPNSWTRLAKGQSVEGLEDPDKSSVQVGGKVLKDAILYNGDTSIVQWTIDSRDGTYLVGPMLIAYCPKGSSTVRDLTGYTGFVIESTYEIVNLPRGGVMAASESGLLATGNMSGWNSPFFAYNGVGSLSTVYTSRIKVLSALPDGHLFFHVWGNAYQIYSESGNQLEYNFVSPFNDLCIDQYLTNYPVSPNVVPAPDQSGFLTATASNDKYSIVYFTKDGEIHCASHVGSGTVPGAMYALLDEDGSWRIYVASKNGTAYAEEGDLDVFKFPPPKSNGGELADGELHTYHMGEPVPVDMAYDSVGGRLWMVSLSTLYYFDEENDTLMSPTSTNGLRMAEYTAIETDVHGNLWLGSSNQGVYRLAQKGNSPDTLAVTHFMSRNGLLNDNVLDLAIDPIYGVAWFAHQNGVTYYQRNDLKDARTHMTDSSNVKVKAYPVPYRPKVHARFTIDGISESSVVSLYNRGGALIRSFRNAEVLGGKVEWDGCDKTGRLVAPGVYYYVINDGSKNKKGKFIIIH